MSTPLKARFPDEVVDPDFIVRAAAVFDVVVDRSRGDARFVVVAGAARRAGRRDRVGRPVARSWLITELEA